MQCTRNEFPVMSNGMTPSLTALFLDSVVFHSYRYMYMWLLYSHRQNTHILNLQTSCHCMCVFCVYLLHGVLYRCAREK